MVLMSFARFVRMSLQDRYFFLHLSGALLSQFVPCRLAHEANFIAQAFLVVRGAPIPIALRDEDLREAKAHASQLVHRWCTVEIENLCLFWERAVSAFFTFTAIGTPSGPSTVRLTRSREK